MANQWNIQAADRPILEAAIGGAILDKMRNHKTSMADLYMARGGQDQRSRQVLESLEGRLRATDHSELVKRLAGDVDDFDRVFSSWNLSHNELALVERTIGARRLAKAEGEEAGTHLDHYRRLGGNNPQTEEALQKVAGS